MATGIFTLLGTGSSGGVPRVGGDWGACDPSEPKNRRLRCSALVQSFDAHGASTNVLIDTSPDLREQLLAEQIGHLDAILYTHDHADQSHGIDDVRPRGRVVTRRSWTCEMSLCRSNWLRFPVPAATLNSCRWTWNMAAFAALVFV